MFKVFLILAFALFPLFGQDEFYTDVEKCYEVDVDALNIREMPSFESMIVGQFYRGEIFCEIDRKSGWIQNDSGWIYNDKNFFSPVEPDMPTIPKFEGDNYPDEKDDLASKYSEQNSTLKDRLISGDTQESTLSEVLRVAISNSDLLKGHYEKVNQFGYRSDEAEADYYPITTFQGGVDKTRASSDLNGEEEYQTYIGTLKVTQSIYSGGATSSEVARYANLKKEAKKNYINVLQNEVLTVIEAYLNVVYQKETYIAASENMKVLNNILEIVNIKKQNGAATLAEESSIRASVADANKSLVTIESRYADAVNEYEYVVGEDVQMFHPYQKEFIVGLEEFPNILSDIEKNNPQLKALNDRYVAKKHELRWNESSYYPKVDLIGTYGDENSYNGGDGYRKEGNIMVQLNQKIFDGFETKYIKKRVLSEMSEINYNIEHQKKRLKWDAKKLYNSVQTLKETYENSATQLNARQDMVNSYWEKFRYSSQDLFILLSAQNDLFQIKFDRLQYNKNRILDSFRLLALQGKLLDYFGLRDEP